MKLLNVWDVRLWDGGSMHNHGFYLERKPDDQEKLIKTYVQRTCPHAMVWAKTLAILDKASEYPELQKSIKRQAALDKLTAEERELLGL